MNFISIFNQILTLFIVLFMGYFIRKKEVIDEHATKKISSLILNLATPMLILKSIFDQEQLNKVVISIILMSIAVYIFLFLMTILVPKLLKIQSKELGIYKFIIMFSNVGFMGYPVVDAIFGTEAVFYASIFNLPFYVLLYTLGIYFISSEKQEIFEYKKMFNPAVIAIIIGFIMLSLSITLPIPIMNSITLLGSLTTPLSMIVIGASLANVKIRKIFLNTRLYIYSIFKLIIFPLILFIVLKNFNINNILMGVSVIIVGMPAGASAVILSKNYGKNDILASEAVFISTMLSIITIPFLALIINSYQ